METSFFSLKLKPLNQNHGVGAGLHAAPTHSTGIRYFPTYAAFHPVAVPWLTAFGPGMVTVMTVMLAFVML
jgi:hypothetical protein